MFSFETTSDFHIISTTIIKTTGWAAPPTGELIYSYPFGLSSRVLTVTLV
jgi:hypothetical protein